MRYPHGSCGRLSPRALLGGQVVENPANAKPRRWTTFATGVLLILALVLAGSSFGVSQAVAAPLFFGSGACLLLAGIGLAGWWLHWGWTGPVALIWLAHIGGDRMVGYGLKYPDSFKHTHFNEV